MNEYPILIRDNEDNKKKKSKNKGGPDTAKWNKLDKNAGGDMEDFQFHDQEQARFQDEDFAPLMELAPAKKKDDDSGLIQRGPGKKKKKDKGMLIVNSNALPAQKVDYNKLYDLN